MTTARRKRDGLPGPAVASPSGGPRATGAPTTSPVTDLIFPPGSEGPPVRALQPFDTAVLTGDPKVAARALLGALLVHETQEGVIAVRLLETEAYGGPEGQDGLVDPASHAYRRRTARNEPMFGLPGTLYVYFTYGMHWCVNVVCGREGVAGAVLLRSGAVVHGAELATANRKGAPFRDLARGPARLSQAVGVQGWANGHDLRFSPLRLAVGWPIPEEAVTWTGRIGLSSAADQPWRVLEANSRYVSGPRAGAVPPSCREAPPVDARIWPS